MVMSCLFIFACLLESIQSGFPALQPQKPQNPALQGKMTVNYFKVMVRFVSYKTEFPLCCIGYDFVAYTIG